VLMRPVGEEFLAYFFYVANQYWQIRSDSDNKAFRLIDRTSVMPNSAGLQTRLGCCQSKSAVLPALVRKFRRVDQPAD
jgi:hypothetical protein